MNIKSLCQYGGPGPIQNWGLSRQYHPSSQRTDGRTWVTSIAMNSPLICVSAKRLQSKKDAAALGDVLVQFEKNKGKHTISELGPNWQAPPVVWMMT